MNRSSVKNAVFLVLVSGAAFLIVTVVIFKSTEDLDTEKFTRNPELKPALLPSGTAPPPDPAFLPMRPVEIAAAPVATRWEAPLGSAHAALTYDAQPFLAWNRRRNSRHLGNDLNGIGGMDTDLGDPVRSAAAGRVIYAGDAGPGWGNMVIVAHATGSGAQRRILQSVYAHLDRVGVTEGMRLRRGEELGTVGKGGGLYPAHLHFELRESTAVNPGEGYHETAMGQLDPTSFLARNRNAAPDFLNPGLESAPGAVEFQTERELE